MTDQLICTTAIALAAKSLALPLVAAIKGAAPTAAPGSDPVSTEPAPGVAITPDPQPAPPDSQRAAHSAQGHNKLLRAGHQTGHSMPRMEPHGPGAAVP